jgi:hypothetical protein
MEEVLKMKGETIQIEGGRNLYNYTFQESATAARSESMFLAKDESVVKPSPDIKPD